MTSKVDLRYRVVSLLGYCVSQGNHRAPITQSFSHLGVTLWVGCEGTPGGPSFPVLLGAVAWHELTGGGLELSKGQDGVWEALGHRAGWDF